MIVRLFSSVGTEAIKKVTIAQWIACPVYVFADPELMGLAPDDGTFFSCFLIVRIF